MGTRAKHSEDESANTTLVLWACGFKLEIIICDVEQAEQKKGEAVESGTAYDPGDVFAHLKARAAGKKVKRPRA